MTPFGKCFYYWAVRMYHGILQRESVAYLGCLYLTTKGMGCINDNFNKLILQFSPFTFIFSYHAIIAWEKLYKKITFDHTERGEFRKSSKYDHITIEQLLTNHTRVVNCQLVFFNF